MIVIRSTRRVWSVVCLLTSLSLLTGLTAYLQVSKLSRRPHSLLTGLTVYLQASQPTHKPRSLLTGLTAYSQPSQMPGADSMLNSAV